MNLRDPRTRRRAVAAARTGCAASTLLVGLSAFGVAGPTAVPASAQAADAPTAGVAQVITPFEVGGPPGSGQALEGGDAATRFSFSLPLNAACTGDTQNASYYVHSYMIAVDADPADLTYDNSGPVPLTFGDPQADYQSPLYQVTGDPYGPAATSPAASDGGPGAIVNIPPLHLATVVVDEVLLPSGEYNVGIACWRPEIPDPEKPAELLPPVLDAYWNAVITVEVDPAATGAARATWTAAAAPEAVVVSLTSDPEDEAAEGADVTFTATVEPEDAAGTITFEDGDDELDDPVTIVDGEAELVVDDLDLGDHTITAEFTPDEPRDFTGAVSSELEFEISEDGAPTSTTSTTVSGASTTSTTSGNAATTTTAPRGGGGPSTGRGGNLAFTGFSFPMVVWGLLALILGRMALLLGRPVRVRNG